MDIPPNFNMYLKGKKKECKLKKTLYGLKQSPQAWFGIFSKFMIIVIYKECHVDYILFVKHLTLGRVIALLVYMGDIIVIGSSLEEREALK